eukprot:CAMPEP_0167753572 /NCGR_PEP_ID=MMETSP0110_2-20121227/7790_1 /TAXON_ID=629695 /ORGANISM="Gymnochlora sp., Strain CCMP2014" /LENGTH=200 /DNA_ID=CAMNT_0007639357 /DNA_START=64 /DNA_END=666 /DNA_ORIENTATION=-
MVPNSLKVLVFASLSLIASANVCTTVKDIDLKKYVGRWYNIYYDNFDKLFSNQDCSSAYYVMKNQTFITVNNTGTQTDSKGKSYYTGYVTLIDEKEPAQFTLHLDGVPRDATYYICELGPATYYDNWYEYAIVTDSSGYSLYVLARDVDRFMKMYNDKVLQRVKDLGYTGFIFGPHANNQTGCPAWEPKWDPSNHTSTIV